MDVPTLVTTTPLIKRVLGTMSVTNSSSQSMCSFSQPTTRKPGRSAPLSLWHVFLCQVSTHDEERLAAVKLAALGKEKSRLSNALSSCIKACGQM